MRAIVFILSLCIATPCPAQKPEMTLFPDGQDTCFAADGLAARPQGQATAVALIRQGTPDPLSEAGAWDRLRVAQGLSSAEHALPVWGAVRLRGESAHRLAWLSCATGDGASVRCRLDCDGGAVGLRGDGSLKLRRAGDGITLDTQGGEGDLNLIEDHRLGPGDRKFRLDASCTGTVR